MVMLGVEMNGCCDDLVGVVLILGAVEREFMTQMLLSQ